MASIKDVAKQAGVSIKTVSRIINNEPNVSAKTSAKVKEAIVALAYSPSHSARGLKSKRSYFISLLSRTGRSDYFSDIQYGAMETSRKHGFHLIVSHLADYECLSPAALKSQISSLLSNPVPDAMIIPPPFGDDPVILEALKDRGVPFVLISPFHPPSKSMSVSFDERMAAYDITQHLLELGHSNIGLIRGIKGYGSTELRTAGFRECLTHAGIQIREDRIATGDFHFQSSFNITEKWLSEPNPPTAIFALNDEMAVAACNAVMRRGLKIPNDIAVAGFDDSSIASMTLPGLTTIRQPTRELGALATELAISSIFNTTLTVDTAKLVPYDLIVRGSTTAD